MTTNPPQHAADFDIIYDPDGTCGYHWDCGKTGVVLGYDVFSPETATWFCSTHWPEFEALYNIVEDRREKGGDNAS